jgi:ubiquinone/menaquinone biosynthesis C-methylase UbiE
VVLLEHLSGGNAVQYKNDVIQHFDAYAESGKWSKLYDHTDPVTNYSFIVRRQRAEELLAPLLHTATSVLDIGCGTGIMAPFFAQRGARYHGVDISKPMITQAAGQLARFPQWHDRVSFATGDVENLQFPDQHFDLTIAMGLLEYLPDPVAAIREALRVTRNGGAILVTVPNRACLNSVAEACLSPVVTTTYHLARGLLRRPVTRGTFSHRRFRPGALDRLLETHGAETLDRVFYNLEVAAYPLKRLFPQLSLWLKSKLEKYHRSSLRVFATGYICLGRKTGTQAAPQETTDRTARPAPLTTGRRRSAPETERGPQGGRPDTPPDERQLVTNAAEAHPNQNHGETPTKA